ncbi:protein FAM83H [Narcine bancroftii]|uniref:protein FAM83H n=1 Tax=Narcine bancroftii TaxID=1343680 RepID=UPI0038323103
MAHRSQCSSFGNVDRDPSHVPPHYKEYYRMAIDVLAEHGIDAYYRFLAAEQVVDFLSSTEIEHINKHLKRPSLSLDSCDLVPSTYGDSSSSGTYWPVHTDIAAPVLDLGWPNTHSFWGPSDVTIFVHPPAPDTLSIKEEVRRLIRSATQVIAIVMDMFTDIDLFDEVLEAASRRIAVYLLLDEMLSHHFLDMVKKCQVDLSSVQFLRVRTLVGSTYYCRSGMSFTGNLIERFLLVDCNAVLCGSYSFMWSFEKIHRSIVQRFQGELVAIFDEEFRILYAQSHPLPGVENLAPAMDNYYGVTPYPSFRRTRPQPGRSFRPPEDVLSQHSSVSWVESDPDHYPRVFRQDGEDRRLKEGPPFRGYMPFDPSSSSILRAKRMEMNSCKRRSYAEGTMEACDPWEHRYGRMTERYDELDARSEHLFRDKLEVGLVRERFHSFHSKHRPFDRFRRSREDLQLDDDSSQHSRRQFEPRNFEDIFLSGYPLQPPLATYEPSNTSKEVRLGSSELERGSGGRLGGSVPKRPSIGQTYTCQKSPTQKQVVDPKGPFQESGLGRKADDQPTKLGLRTWRLGSYLGDHIGLPGRDTEQPGTSEPPVDSGNEEADCGAPAAREPSQFSSYKRLELYKFPRDSADGQSAEGEQPGRLVRHASLRGKFNLLQHRGSRLRSSLIFNSSKLEQHASHKERRVLSIREQLPSAVKEGEEQEAPAAMEPAEETGQSSAPQRPEAAIQSGPGQSAPPLLAPEPVKPQAKPGLDVPRDRSKLELQLSRKVQDVLSKMGQRQPRSLETQPGPELPAKPSPPAPETDPIPSPPAGPQPETVSAPRETLSQPSGMAEDHKRPLAASPPGVSADGSASARLHAPAGGLNSVQEEGAGVEAALSPSPSVPKVVPNLPGEGKAPVGPAPGLRSTATDNEKGPERVARGSHGEGEDKLHRSPLHSPPAKAVPAAQGGRYSSTTSNILYSSNLRDDTKVILEQISANSQKNRAESSKPQPPPAGEVDGPVATAPAKAAAGADQAGTEKKLCEDGKGKGRVPDLTDPLIKKMDSFRKERRVYSRFEVFYKKDEALNSEGHNVDGSDRKKSSKFIPKFFGSFRRF